MGKVMDRIVSGAALVVAAGVVVGLLAGCAPANLTPQPHVTSISGGAHKNGTLATPSPTPTVSEPATPPMLVGVTCANLIPLATVKSLLVASGVGPQQYEGLYYEVDGNDNIATIALQQDGGLGCTWSDSLGDAQLMVRVIPNAAAAFAAASTALTATDDVAEHLVSSVPTWGDKSYTDCGDKNFSGQACDFDILVGSFWVNINENRDKYVTGPAYPEDATQLAAVAAIVASVKALPAPAAAWIPPTDASKIPTSCAGLLSSADARSAISEPSVTLVSGLVDDDVPWDQAVFAATGALDCEWWSEVNGDMADVEVAVLPGSSWAWSTTMKPVHDPVHFPLNPITGIADSAMGTCNASLGQCDLYFEVDKSWFLVELNDDHPTLTDAESVAKDVVTAAS
jgi:hypothetical protein